MLDFRKQFQEIIEQSYIPFNIDKAATSDVWSNIYKLILPNIPEKLFRYRKIDDKGYTIESLKDAATPKTYALDTHLFFAETVILKAIIEKIIQIKYFKLLIVLNMILVIYF